MESVPEVFLFGRLDGYVCGVTGTNVILPLRMTNISKSLTALTVNLEENEHMVLEAR